MNGQQISQYSNLITQVIKCPAGQERDILREYKALLNADLIDIVDQMLVSFQQQGLEQEAKKLAAVSTWLVKEVSSQARASEKFAQDQPKIERLLAEIFELIVQRGNVANPDVAELVYHRVAASGIALDESLLAVLPTAVSSIISGLTEEKRLKTILATGVFGQIMHVYPYGGPDSGVIASKLAAIPIEEAVRFVPQQSMPLVWAHLMMTLATVYLYRLDGDRAKTLEQTISIYKQCLEVVPRTVNAELWGMIMMNLGIAYSQQTKDKAQNIEAAIAAYRLALEVIIQDQNPAAWATLTMNLGIVYAQRIADDKAQNIEKAIDYLEQSLEIRTREASPHDWSLTVGNLAAAYADRVEGDRSQNLARSIAFAKQSLEVLSKSRTPVEWATTWMNIGTSYAELTDGNRSQNLEWAIKAYERSLEVLTYARSPVEWSKVMTNLATVYMQRIQGDRSQNIEQAIEMHEQSLRVRTFESMPVEWAQVRLNLSSAYASRLLGDRQENIRQIVRHCEAALQVMTYEKMPVEWALLTSSLANTYCDRSYGNRSDNIEQAIATYAQALRVQRPETAPISWAQTTTGLASAYTERISGNRTENLKHAIALSAQTLSVFTREKMPYEWAKAMINLARTYKERTDGQKEQNINRAIAYYSKALEVMQPDRFPSGCRDISWLLGALYSEQQQWNQAADTYNKGVEAVSILYQSSLFLASQAVELSGSDILCRDAAYAQAKAGRLKAAVLTIERSRARSLSEALERNQPNLEALEASAPRTYLQYRTAVAALRQLEQEERATDNSKGIRSNQSSPAALRERAHRVRQDFSAAVKKLRQQPGYEDFFASADWDDIAAAVRTDQPIVYLAAATYGGLALIVRKNEEQASWVHPIWLDALTHGNLTKMLLGDSEATLAGWFGAYNNQSQAPDDWFQTIEQITHQLWPLLMGPLTDYLARQNIAQAVLVPTGYLSFLPLHAAWTKRAVGRCYALDRVLFTYSANAQALQVARSRVARPSALSTSASSLLVVNEPRPSQAEALPYSTREVQMAVRFFRQHQALQHEQVTRTQVLAALPDHSVLHFSCHGTSSFEQPLDSGLLMANDELLTLKDLLSLRLKDMRLAILSACDTGVSGVDLPDEVVSLPTGLLQAGAAGVIASLWSVSDLSTMILISRFYWLWRDHNIPPAQALTQAQQWLRDAAASEVEAHCKTFMPELFQPEKTLSEADQALLLEMRLDFSEPYHWAAFSYTGV